MRKSFLAKTWNKIVNVFDNKIVKFELPAEKCGYCSVNDATWKNTLVNDYTCDECVPRGCSCRLYKKTKRAAFLAQYDYEKDKDGKELPCEDWEKLK